MSKYATIDDVQARYGADLPNLLDLHEELVTSKKLFAALNDADALIDSHLCTRYQLPLNAVPLTLVRIACVFVRYFIEPNGVTEKTQKEYDACIALLKSVASGESNLGISSDDLQPTTDDDNGIQMQSDPCVWARKSSTGFI